MKNNMSIDYSLYLVTDRGVLGNNNIYESIEQAIEGGVTVLQLREKNLTSMEFYKIAKKVKLITDKHNIPLIINDRIDIALAVDADGVHIGPDDIPVDVARDILGSDKIIGASTCSVAEALSAEKQGATYLGVGAMYPTSTKRNTDDVTIEGLAEIKSSVNIPVVGIGGINEANAAEVMTAKVDGIAVVSAILGKNDIRKASKELSEIVNNRK